MSKVFVLESTIVSLIMMSSVAFVATMPAEAPFRTEELVQIQAKDLLRTAMETPRSAPCNGDSLLEALIIEGINEKDEEWKRKVSIHFEEGIDAELFLDNGFGLYTLHSSSGFKGTTAEVPIQPDFTFLQAVQDLPTADGQSRLGVNPWAVHQSELLRLRGEAIEFSVTSQSAFSASPSTQWGITALLSQSSDSKLGGNVSWKTSSESLSLVVPVNPADALAASSGVLLTLEVEVAPPLALSDGSGLEVTVTLPPDWSLIQAESKQWSVTSLSPLKLRLTNGAPGVTATELRLRPPSNPIHPFDVLHARLGNGTLGESSLVVTYPTSVERSLPRAVYPTVPYPLRPGTRALFGVAFANGGEKTVVTRVDVEIPGGYDVWRNEGQGAELFAEAEVLRPADRDGAWSWVDARHLRWEGERVVEALGASSWAFGVLVTGDVGEATSVEPPRSDGPEGRLRFANGFEHRSTRWGPVPGVVRHDVPPASGPDAADGYPWASASVEAAAAGGAVTEHAVELRSVEASLESRASYEVSPAAGDLLRLRSSLANSSFAVRERMVPVGGVLQSDADFESVVNELGRMGVADTTLTMELYAPPSRGCEPTATWSRDSRSLALARVRDLALWDPLGAGASDLFLVAEDGQAYRVNAAGSPLWSVPLGAKGVRLLTAEFGPGGTDRRLFVASEDGAVHRLDPVSGALVWSAQAAQGVGTLDGVTSMAAQPGEDRLLVGTRLGAVVALDASTGARAEDAQPSSGAATAGEAGAVVRVEVSAAAGVVVGHARAVRLLSPIDLSLVAERRVEGTGDVVGFAAAQGRVLVATAQRTLVLTLPDLAEVGAGVPHASAAVLAEAGDATGDGVPDLVVAMKDRGLVAVSGASGGVAWTRTEEPWVDVMPDDVPFGALDPWRATRKGHVCEKVAATYQTASVACAWGSRRDQSEPLFLRVGAERTYYARVDRGQPVMAALDRAGGIAAQWALPQVPDAMAAGPWPPGGEAVAVAGTEGTVDVHRDQDGRWHEPVLRVRPTDFVGRFTFFTPVPGGGFFGTHLLVATLSWTEGGSGGADAGTVRQARLFDWFEVVGPDGKPVLEPSYRVVLVVQDRGDPLER